MSNTEENKFPEAIPQESSKPVGKKKRGKPVPNHATAAEQSRESQESQKASVTQGTIRERMVQIGRANRQTGRQGQ